MRARCCFCDRCYDEVSEIDFRYFIIGKLNEINREIRNLEEKIEE